jgi:alcohol dehydrogenase/L-iditol 2-dehydrogenase
MRAAVLSGSRRLEVVDWPTPVSQPDEVLIRIEGVGICGSDGAMYAGHWTFPKPFVIGHEGFGRIVAVGSAVRDRAVGSLVVVEPNIVCRECPLCRKGMSSLCDQKRSIGVGTDGLCAEFARVPAEFAWPLPDTIRPEDAVCIEPLAVALAAIREARLQPGAHVTVFGAGAQGLLLTIALAAQGAAPHVVDPQPERLTIARELGAGSTSVEAPEGPASDCVFETSGVPAAVTAAIAVAGPGATVVLVGLGHQPATLDAARVVRQRLRIQGSLIYQHPIDFISTIDLVTSSALQPGVVLKHAFPLEDADRAFRTAPTLPGKSWITLNFAREVV